MREIVGAFAGCEGFQAIGDGGGDGVEGPWSVLADEVFELGEDLFDRVEVWGVFGQEHEPCADAADRRPDGFSFVGAEVVEDHDVAWLEGRDQELLDISSEALAVDRAVEQAGRVDPIVAQGGEEGRGLPVAVRDLVDEPLSLPSPTAEAGHVGLGPCLVDEDEARRVDQTLIEPPALPVAADVRPVLLARHEGLFLNVTPIRPKKRLIIEVSDVTPRSARSRSHKICNVMSGFAARAASRKSR